MKRAALLMIGLCWLQPAISAAPLPDPTQPSRPRFDAATRRAANGNGPLQVQGIVGNAASRLAIVNGQLVRRGSWIGNAEIIAVLVDGVEYRSNGRVAISRLPLQR